MNNRFQRGRRVLAFVAGLGAAIAVSVAAPAVASAAPSTSDSPTITSYQPAKGAPSSTPDATTNLDWVW
jgi:hypothetical protein